MWAVTTGVAVWTAKFWAVTSGVADWTAEVWAVTSGVADSTAEVQGLPATSARVKKEFQRRHFGWNEFPVRKS